MLLCETVSHTLSASARSKITDLTATNEFPQCFHKPTRECQNIFTLLTAGIGPFVVTPRESVFISSTSEGDITELCTFCIPFTTGPIMKWCKNHKAWGKWIVETTRKEKYHYQALPNTTGIPQEWLFLWLLCYIKLEGQYLHRQRKAIDRLRKAWVLISC